MPKDVSMNSNHVESGMTAVDAYKQTTGACGGIDFWGNFLIKAGNPRDIYYDRCDTNCIGLNVLSQIVSYVASILLRNHKKHEI